MKQIYLRIEHYSGEEYVFAESYNATIEKGYIYFGGYKIKKEYSEIIPRSEKKKIINGRENRLIKVYVAPKSRDPRLIELK